MDNPKGYYYLHTNGDLIYKNIAVVDSDPECFDSTFVRKFWKMNFNDRFDAWTFMLEALALDCNIDRAIELCSKWGLDKIDSFMMLKFFPYPNELMKKGVNIFVKKVLKMNIEDYWKEVRENTPKGFFTVINKDLADDENFISEIKKYFKSGE